MTLLLPLMLIGAMGAAATFFGGGDEFETFFPEYEPVGVQSYTSIQLDGGGGCGGYGGCQPSYQQPSYNPPPLPSYGQQPQESAYPSQEYAPPSYEKPQSGGYASGYNNYAPMPPPIPYQNKPYGGDCKQSNQAPQNNFGTLNYETMATNSKPSYPQGYGSPSQESYSPPKQQNYPHPPQQTYSPPPQKYSPPAPPQNYQAPQQNSYSPPQQYSPPQPPY